MHPTSDGATLGASQRRETTDAAAGAVTPFRFSTLSFLADTVASGSAGHRTDSE
jgi:hypothetical protein